MPGGEHVRAVALHMLEQRAEFDHFVAEHAWARRFSVLVCRDEVGDDCFLKLLGEIDRCMAQPYRICDCARVGNITLCLCFAFALAGAAELHCRAEAVIALLPQQQRRDGGIHPAAHCHGNCRSCGGGRAF